MIWYLYLQIKSSWPQFKITHYNRGKKASVTTMPRSSHHNRLCTWQAGLTCPVTGHGRAAWVGKAAFSAISLATSLAGNQTMVSGVFHAMPSYDRWFTEGNARRKRKPHISDIYLSFQWNASTAGHSLTELNLDGGVIIRNGVYDEYHTWYDK